MWAPSDDQRTQIKQAGLQLAPGEQLTSAVSQGAELEGVTAILLLTDEDHYNALAATTLAGSSGAPVYRLAPSNCVPPYTPGEALFAPALNGPAVTARYTSGSRITTQPASAPAQSGTDVMFLITPDGVLTPSIISRPPASKPGDTLVLLAPASRKRRRTRWMI